MKPIIILIIIGLSCDCLPQSQFQLTIGGSNEDFASDIIQSADGGFIVAGTVASFGAGSYDIYVAKFDVSGSLQWSRTIGGARADYATSIAEASDGGYVITGYTDSLGRTACIVKLNSSGVLQWARRVGGTNFGYFVSIIRTADGGFVATGLTNSFGAGLTDMYIVKLDASGLLQWSRTVGNAYYNYGSSITQTTDGGYALAGSMYASIGGNSNMYIVKLDSNGMLQWSRSIAGTSDVFDNSIIQTADSGYVAVGDALYLGGGSWDIYVVKLNAGGVFQWGRTIGGTNSDHASSIIQTPDGGYAVIGSTTSFGAGNSDMYFVKLNATGNPQWSKTVGGAGYDAGSSIVQTQDGSYIAVGSTAFGAGGSDIFIVKFDANGIVFLRRV
jgi:hypothetical protein